MKLGNRELSSDGSREILNELTGNSPKLDEKELERFRKFLKEIDLLNTTIITKKNEK